MVNKKIAVVGGAGFIGHSLFTSGLFDPSELIVFVSKDKVDRELSCNFPSMRECDSIIWLASKVNPSSAEKYPEVARQEASEWHLFLTKLVSVCDKLPHIIYISSAGCVYDNGSVPASETSPAMGINAYGRHKIAMENILNRSGIPRSILRASNVYGKGQLTGRGQGVIAEWVSSIKTGQHLNVYGDISASRDYIYIDDLLRCIKIASQVKYNGVLNIGSGNSVSLIDIITMLEEIEGQAIEYENLHARALDRFSYSLSIDKAEQILNWKPRINLQDGLKLIFSEV
jgi:UDP-glucose 4-epimerase